MAPLNGASLLLWELVWNISGSNEYVTVENGRVRLTLDSPLAHASLGMQPRPNSLPSHSSVFWGIILPILASLPLALCKSSSSIIQMISIAQ